MKLKKETRQDRWARIAKLNAEMRAARPKRQPIKKGSLDQDFVSVKDGTYQATRYTIREDGLLLNTVVDPWMQYSGPQPTTRILQVTASVSSPDFPRRKPDNYFSRTREFRSDPAQNFSAEWSYAADNGYAGRIGKVNQRVLYFGNAKTAGCDDNRGPPADDPYPGLVLQLLDKLSSAKTNTAVAMAEVHKTAAHVAKTATRLATAYRALRRLRFGEFAQALGLTEKVEKDIRRKYVAATKRKSFLTYASTRNGYQSRLSSFAADSWLEYSYAWKPLLKDVYDHADALAQTMVERQWVVREAKAKVKTSKKVRTSTYSSCWRYYKDSSDEQWQAMEVRYSVPPGTVSAVRAFGLTNPLEVAWELVPFSFVADWFIPIGDAIKGLTATVGLTFHSGWRTNRSLHKIISGFVGESSHPLVQGTQIVTGSGGAEMTRWWFAINRGLLLTFPYPVFPPFKDWRANGRGDVFKDVSHGLSAIALLKTVFLDKRTDLSRTIR